SGLAWKRTFSGRARREAQVGRQYTPVVRTEYQNRPSAAGSRASTAAQRGSRSVASAARVRSIVAFIYALLPSLENTVGTAPWLHNPALAVEFCPRARPGPAAPVQSTMPAVGATARGAATSRPRPRPCRCTP